MKKIKIAITVSLRMMGAIKTSIIEVPEDFSEKQIEEAARQRMFEMIEWSYLKTTETEGDYCPKCHSPKFGEYKQKFGYCYNCSFGLMEPPQKLGQ